MTRYFISMYTDGPSSCWNVIDRQTQEWVRRFPTKEAAEAYAADLEAQALALAIQHIEHMAAWIAKQNAGYSFESLGEDMPGIRAALATGKQEGAA